MFFSLLQALFSTISEDEAKWRQDLCAEPVVSESVISASPIRKGTTTDLVGDIKRLEMALYGGHPMEEGFCIDISLQDLLKICPRSRHRSDAFRTLIKALAERGVTLKIIKK